MESLRQFILKAKAQYGEVYSIIIEDEEYIFRLLTRKEYAELVFLSDDKDISYEIICKICIINPKEIDYKNIGGGIAANIAEKILDESGFGKTQKANDYFKYYRRQMETFEKQAEAMVQAVFTHLSEEDMMEWNVSKFMRNAAKAEWILKNIMGHPIEFKDEVERAEEGEEVEPPSFKELGIEMRKQGKDPMIEYSQFILKPNQFVEVPFIAGTEYWKKVYN